MNGQNKEFIQLVECPRDAMQGWKEFIPTSKKIEYLNALLEVGFDTLDFGSFVSPKAIPQLADTKEVLSGLIPSKKTKLLAIVANLRGAEEACAFEQITSVGFPFSVSETFQKRNTNATIQTALQTVEQIHNICLIEGKQFVVYLSMAFGNPYGDPYSKDIVFQWAETMSAMAIPVISLADTVGLATAEQVSTITEYLVKQLPTTEIGVHLHSTIYNWQEKIEAAYQSGCRRFDGSLKGIGGCPMAEDALVGNINTEWMIEWFNDQGVLKPLNVEALLKSGSLAAEIFLN